MSSHNAYAVNSINWTIDGGIGTSPDPPYIQLFSNVGNILQSSPFSILVDATDENDFTTNGIIDTINVIVTSVDDSNAITYTLTETGPNDGIFTGTNFVFLDGNYKFQTTDIVNVNLTLLPTSGCDTDNTTTLLDSRSGGPDNGVKVFSDTDLGGVGLILTETGENTCEFTGQVKFTTSGTTDEITGTLQISQGDILSFEDRTTHFHYNAQI
ncbi:MAG: hypothetical protein HW410_889, partial [Nitrosarchaeum sp.]|nr:hypothetical protein [Nitrosarchaeum sp.]